MISCLTLFEMALDWQKHAFDFERPFDHGSERITLALGNRAAAQGFDAPLRLILFATNYKIWLLGHAKCDWPAA
jgi:hypothetical protein